MMNIRKTIAIFLGIILLLSMSGCYYSREEINEIYENGYSAGYSEGYYEAEYEAEDKYFEETNRLERYAEENYSEGYHEGYREGYEDAFEAIHDSISTRVGSAADAAYAVGILLGLEDPHEDDEIPSKEAYEKYVEELYLFWAFFYGNGYTENLEFN